MKTSKQEELKELLNPNLSMPKMYSFDETRRLVKLALTQERESVIEEVESRLPKKRVYITDRNEGREEAVAEVREILTTLKQQK